MPERAFLSIMNNMLHRRLCVGLHVRRSACPFFLTNFFCSYMFIAFILLSVYSSKKKLERPYFCSHIRGYYACTQACMTGENNCISFCISFFYFNTHKLYFSRSVHVLMPAEVFLCGGATATFCHFPDMHIIIHFNFLFVLPASLLACWW